ncbi:MAG: 6-hydroxycyclohex-1-ene-1-carbonyl-CoA dehydrogenase [Chitinispirillaceae bacterium]|nr:6-hydroxycyclohex-1-ene-1-carbonyl-CoA dehydrogenase [Chitinispirillaceae bacterium]
MKNTEARGWYFTGVDKPLEKKNFSVKEPQADEAVVAIAGCGLCHTDLGFIGGRVKTNAELPLILGHEISGGVVAAGSAVETFIGKNVVIPAVLPCGECELCKNGRSNVCRSQKMPGNDFNGGFASHITVPARYLCEIPTDLGDVRVSSMSVIADAVTTPYQSLVRSNLRKDDLAIVIGAGGIGIYMVQLAANRGAAVIALDVDEAKIERAKKLGARFGINTSGMDEKALKEKIRTFVKEQRLPKHRWKIFETSGTAAGQSAAFSLLSFAGTIAVVGFTMDKISIRLSNMMAFDADMFGNWGCKPEYYPAVVDKVLKKEINILDTVEERPLDSINEVISLAMQHKLEKRVIFIP